MIEELSPEQLEAQAGGRVLRTEVRSFCLSDRHTTTYNLSSLLQSVPTHSRPVRNAEQALRTVLNQSKLVLPLFVLLAQLRNSLMYKSSYTHLKLLGEMYDRVSLD